MDMLTGLLIKRQAEEAIEQTDRNWRAFHHNEMNRLRNTYEENIRKKIHVLFSSVDENNRPHRQIRNFVSNFLCWVLERRFGSKSSPRKKTYAIIYTDLILDLMAGDMMLTERYASLATRLFFKFAWYNNSMIKNKEKTAPFQNLPKSDIFQGLVSTVVFATIAKKIVEKWRNEGYPHFRDNVKNRKLKEELSKQGFNLHRFLPVKLDPTTPEGAKNCVVYLYNLLRSQKRGEFSGWFNYVNDFRYDLANKNLNASQRHDEMILRRFERIVMEYLLSYAAKDLFAGYVYETTYQNIVYTAPGDYRDSRQQMFSPSLGDKIYKALEARGLVEKYGKEKVKQLTQCFVKGRPKDLKDIQLSNDEISEIYYEAYWQSSSFRAMFDPTYYDEIIEKALEKLKKYMETELYDLSKKVESAKSYLENLEKKAREIKDRECTSRNDFGKFGDLLELFRLANITATIGTGGLERADIEFLYLLVKQTILRTLTFHSPSLTPELHVNLKNHVAYPGSNAWSVQALISYFDRENLNLFGHPAQQYFVNKYKRHANITSLTYKNKYYMTSAIWGTLQPEAVDNIQGKKPAMIDWQDRFNCDMGVKTPLDEILGFGLALDGGEIVVTHTKGYASPITDIQNQEKFYLDNSKWPTTLDRIADYIYSQVGNVNYGDFYSRYRSVYRMVMHEIARYPYIWLKRGAAGRPPYLHCADKSMEWVPDESVCYEVDLMDNEDTLDKILENKIDVTQKAQQLAKQTTEENRKKNKKPSAEDTPHIPDEFYDGILENVLNGKW